MREIASLDWHRRKALGSHNPAWVRCSWVPGRHSWVQERYSWVQERYSWVQGRHSWVQEHCRWVQERRKVSQAMYRQVLRSLVPEPCKVLPAVCKAVQVLRSLGPEPYRALRAECRAVQVPGPDTPATGCLLWVPEQHTPGALPDTLVAQP